MQRKPTRAEWMRARDLMAQSIRGHGAHSAEDGELLERLLAADPKQYERIHAEVKDVAIAEINPLWRKP